MTTNVDEKCGWYREASRRLIEADRAAIAAREAAKHAETALRLAHQEHKSATVALDIAINGTDTKHTRHIVVRNGDKESLREIPWQPAWTLEEGSV